MWAKDDRMMTLAQRIEREMVGLDVCKANVKAFPSRTGRGRHVGKRRCDHRSAHIHGLEKQLQAEPTVCHTVHGALESEVGRNSGFQFPNQGSLIGEVVSFPYALEEVGIGTELREKGSGDLNGGGGHEGVRRKGGCRNPVRVGVV